MVCRKTRHLGRISRLVTGCLVFGLLLAPLALPLATSTTAHAQSVRVVPEGNRFKSQPKIPFASSRRTAASKSSYDAKFDKVLAVLKRDRRLMGSIKRVSARYGIDPIHIIGAIVGEHTYNYDTLDSAQSYYVKALAYAGIRFDFHEEDEGSAGGTASKL